MFLYSLHPNDFLINKGLVSYSEAREMGTSADNKERRGRWEGSFF